MNKKQTIEYYNKLLAEHGSDSPRAVSWTNEDVQIERFLTIAKYVPKNYCITILDYGCGLGDLSPYLYGEYTGYDINENLIKAAKEKEPIRAYRTFTTTLPKKKFDAIVSSGVFCLAPKEDLDKWVKWAWKHLKDNGVLVFNLPTTYVNFKDRNWTYHDPKQVYNFAKLFTPYVNIISDYLPYDYTVVMHKRKGKK